MFKASKSARSSHLANEPNTSFVNLNNLVSDDTMAVLALPLKHAPNRKKEPSEDSSHSRKRQLHWHRFVYTYTSIFNMLDQWA